MTLRDSVALATFSIRHRNLLRFIVSALLTRVPAEDAPQLPLRLDEESPVAWGCRCRTPNADAEALERDTTDALRLADGQLARAAALGINPIALDDDRYPPLLRAIPDPPLVLWTRGQAAHLSRPSIAVVGARAATLHGLEMARFLSGELARAGLVIVSGLARGVDSAAHAAALAAGGGTVAVLGCGIDRVYPPEHDELARNIQRAGVVLSEFPPGVPPLAHHFPLRNRIISGLSHAVVVVEAPEKSGSLITAASAAEQGRDVFVVPGLVTGGRNRGGHLLIRDGAKLVETADDILEEVGRPVVASDDCPREPGKVPLETAAFTIDELAARTGEPPSVVLARLLELELSGQIQRIGGGRFVRSASRVLP